MLLGAGLALGMKANAQTVLLETFEGASEPAVPTGWTNTTTTADGGSGWISHSGTLDWALSTLPAHTRYMCVNNYADSGNHPAYLESPSFNLTSSANPYLSVDFYFHRAQLVPTAGGTKERAWIDVSSTGGSTWTTVDSFEASLNADNSAYAWKTKYVNLSAYAGMPNVKVRFVYTDNGRRLIGCAVDNFEVFNAQDKDIWVQAATPATGDPAAAYKPVGGNFTFGGTAFNKGTSTISSMTVYYQVGAAAPVSSVVSVSIPSMTSAAFTCSTPYSVTAVGALNVKVWAVVSGDPVHTNDTASTTVNGVSFMPTKRLVFEEGTGTWCGWCVRGIVYMDSMYHMYGSGVSLVAVHNGDPMTVSAYDSWMSGKIGGYPSALADRSLELDPSDIIDYYNQHHNDFGFANVTATSTITGTSLSVPVTVTPAVNLSGDYRLTMALTEYDVTGTGSGYDQHNYYAGGGYGSMTIGSTNFATLTNPVPAAQMEYDHVARAISPSVTGTSGSLPASMTAGTAYTATLTGTLSSSWNKDKMKAIVMMLDNATGRVMNSYGFNIGAGLSVNNVNSDVNGVTIYPNPAANDVNVMFSLEKATEVSVAVIDVTGRVVANVAAHSYNAGDNNVAINVANLASGIYTVRIATAESTITRQLSVQK